MPRVNFMAYLLLLFSLLMAMRVETNLLGQIMKEQSLRYLVSFCVPLLSLLLDFVSFARSLQLCVVKKVIHVEEFVQKSQIKFIKH